VVVAAPAEVWVSICNMALRVALAAPASEDTFIEHFLLKHSFEAMLNGSTKV
jgi:hypothetical protein